MSVLISYPKSCVTAIELFKIVRDCSDGGQPARERSCDKYYYEIMTAAHHGKRSIKFPLKRDTGHGERDEEFRIMADVEILFPGIRSYYTGADDNSYAFEWGHDVAYLPSTEYAASTHLRAMEALKRRRDGAAAAASDAAAAARVAQEERHQRELRQLQEEIYALKGDITNRRWNSFAEGAKQTAAAREEEIIQLKKTIGSLNETIVHYRTALYDALDIEEEALTTAVAAERRAAAAETRAAAAEARAAAAEARAATT
jgi:hypothetical protein